MNKSPFRIAEKTTLKVLCYSLVITGIIACGSTQKKSSPAQSQNIIKNQSKNAQNGYILGSFTTTCRDSKKNKKSCKEPFKVMSLLYRNSDNYRKQDRLTIKQTGKEKRQIDYSSGDEHRFYFCQAIEEGQHEFFNIYFNDLSFRSDGYTLNREDYFSLPFKVKAGQLNYVGALNLQSGKRIDYFENPLPTTAYLFVKDEISRDISKAKDKCPTEYKSDYVKVNILDSSEIPQPLILKNEL